MRLWVSIAAILAVAALPVAAQAQSGSELHFSYTMPGDGPYVRQASGTIHDPQAFRDMLKLLQPPQGAHGAYGMIGDDNLLGKEPGYGLRVLGGLAREYITFDSIYVVQPPGFEDIGVQSGTFTDVKQMNDTTLGWVFFDLRSQFESGIADFLRPHPAPQSTYLVFFDFTEFNLTEAASKVAKMAADSYKALGAYRIDIVGHADSAEDDVASWHKMVKQETKQCKTDPTIRSELACKWKGPNAIKLGLMRAQATAEVLETFGVPKSAIHVSSAGAGDPLVPTDKGTREPQNRFATVMLR